MEAREIRARSRLDYAVVLANRAGIQKSETQRTMDSGDFHESMHRRRLAHTSQVTRNGASGDRSVFLWKRGGVLVAQIVIMPTEWRIQRASTEEGNRGGESTCMGPAL